MPTIPTGTVTFLFTDIEGSTKHWEHQPQAMQLALARHDAILQAAIDARGGYTFKTVGDAFCAAFATAPDALNAILVAQRALHAEPWSAEIGSLKVRCALHTGTSEEREGDYFGPTLNRVARLLAAAHGGQILLSLATMELVRDCLPFEGSLRDLGEHRLKDLIRPEHVFQLVTSDLPSDFAPLKTLEAFAHNLPVQLTSFVGREREMAEVKRLLGTTHLLTLTGSGGTGKTRLSLQVAADLVETFAHGVWFIELSAITDPALIPQAVASIFGVQESAGRSLITALSDYFREKQLLLILDNCEHLIDAAARLGETLLKASPGLRILASSREALGIPGETVWRVPSLSVPDIRQPTTRDQLTQYEAVRLFIDRALAVKPDFSVNNDNAPAIAQICVRLDGIPLAIELAAARIKILSAQQILVRLDDRFRLLTGSTRTALPRQQTLRALVDWSYQLLSEPEQVLFHRLSVFAGSWSLEAAETVCVYDGIESNNILPLLAQLSDKSLIGVEEHVGEVRYRLLETIREYAREKLNEAHETYQIQKRHFDFFLEMAGEAEPHIKDEHQVIWLNRLEMEHDNIRAALEWCEQRVDGGADCLNLASCLYNFWSIRAHLVEGRRWLLGMLERTKGIPVTLERKALYGASTFVEGATKIKFLEQSLEICRQEADAWNTAHQMIMLGAELIRQLDRERGFSLVEAGLAQGQTLNDKWIVMRGTEALGGYYLTAGDYAQAKPLLTEALALARSVGDRRTIGHLLTALGVMALSEGHYESAQEFFNESLRLAVELGAQQTIASLGLNLGSIAALQGNYIQAVAEFQHSLAVFRNLGIRLGIATALLYLGNAFLEQKNLEQAKICFEESLTLGREMADKGIIAKSMNILGIIAQYRKDYARAKILFTESLMLWHEVNDEPGIAAALNNLGDLAQQEGHHSEALQYFEESMAIVQKQNSKQDNPTILASRMHWDFADPDFEQTL